MRIRIRISYRVVTIYTVSVYIAGNFTSQGIVDGSASNSALVLTIWLRKHTI